MEVSEEVNGMVGFEPEKPPSDSTEVEEAVDRMVLVESSNPLSDLLEDGEGNLMVGVQEANPILESNSSIQVAALLEPRRSSRYAP